MFVCENMSICFTLGDKNFEVFEEYCKRAETFKFKCIKSARRIYFFQVCNYISDCEDNSDEEFCGGFLI